MVRYYQSSNKLPLGGVLLTLLMALPVAVVLAFAYVYLNWFIARAYFSFCFAVLVGGALGWWVLRLARWGHLRSVGGVALLGLLIGAVAVYVQWGVYLTLVTGMKAAKPDTVPDFDAAVFVGLLLRPAAMWELMHLISADGLWSVLGVAPSGWFLWLIWLLEALLILLTTMGMGISTIDQPYSEVARTWATEQKLTPLLAAGPDTDAARTALEAGRYAEVLHPATVTDDTAPGEFWQLRLHHVPADASCLYLSLDQVSRKLTAKGKLETDTTPLITHLGLSPADHARLTEYLRRLAQPEQVSASGLVG